MEIERIKGIKVKMPLNDIPSGEVFEHKEALFMKADNKTLKLKSNINDCILAINIGNGWVTAFSKYALVHPVKAKVVVNE